MGHCWHHLAAWRQRSCRKPLSSRLCPSMHGPKYSAVLESKPSVVSALSVVFLYTAVFVGLPGKQSSVIQPPTENCIFYRVSCLSMYHPCLLVCVQLCFLHVFLLSVLCCFCNELSSFDKNCLLEVHPLF